MAARTQDSAHTVIHDLYGRLVPGCIPVFTSDGLNQYFYALTAHFGQWLAGVGRRARQWQVAGLIYGQVKKTYRRRKVVRVMHVLRCRTHADLSAALRGLGLSGQITTAFIERVKKDSAPKPGRPHSPHMLHGPGSTTVAGRPGMVARIRAFRAPA
jgi:hypothetical protein